MRAALIQTFGEPTKVLELADVPEPSGPAAGEVLVGVEYAPINMNDLYLIQGAFPVRPSLPSIIGNEGVGSNWRCWASIHPRRLYSSTKRPISRLATGSSRTR